MTGLPALTAASRSAANRIPDQAPHNGRHVIRPGRRVARSRCRMSPFAPSSPGARAPVPSTARPAVSLAPRATGPAEMLCHPAAAQVRSRRGRPPDRLASLDAASCPAPMLPGHRRRREAASVGRFRDCWSATPLRRRPAFAICGRQIRPPAALSQINAAADRARLCSQDRAARSVWTTATAVLPSYSDRQGIRP